MSNYWLDLEKKSEPPSESSLKKLYPIKDGDFPEPPKWTDESRYKKRHAGNWDILLSSGAVEIKHATITPVQFEVEEQLLRECSFSPSPSVTQAISGRIHWQPITISFTENIGNPNVEWRRWLALVQGAQEAGFSTSKHEVIITNGKEVWTLFGAFVSSCCYRAIWRSRHQVDVTFHYDRAHHAILENGQRRLNAVLKRDEFDETESAELGNSLCRSLFDRDHGGPHPTTRP